MKKIQGFKKTTTSIVILLSIWMVGSCTSSTKTLQPLQETASQWDAAINKHIADPQRAITLKKFGQQLTDTANLLKQGAAVFNQKAMALNANYYATDAQVQQITDEFTQQRNEHFAHYRDLIFAMRSQVSADEWKELTR